MWCGQEKYIIIKLGLSRATRVRLLTCINPFYSHSQATPINHQYLFSTIGVVRNLWNQCETYAFCITQSVRRIHIWLIRLCMSLTEHTMPIPRKCTPSVCLCVCGFRFWNLIDELQFICSDKSQSTVNCEQCFDSWFNWKSKTSVGKWSQASVVLISTASWDYSE